MQAYFTCMPVSQGIARHMNVLCDHVPNTRETSTELTVCGGRHSSSVSDPPCSLLPPGAASNTVQRVAPVPKPTVVCGVLGADAALVGMVLEES